MEPDCFDQPSTTLILKYFVVQLGVGWLYTPKLFIVVLFRQVLEKSYQQIDSFLS